MKKRLLCLVLPIITLIFEILPYGAVLNFMLPAVEEGVPAGRFRELYSYFDLMPFGYGNFAPFITALMTCVIFLLLVIYVLAGKVQLARAAKGMLLACFIISFGPLILGPQFLSVVGVLISLLLIGEYMFLCFYVKI